MHLKKAKGANVSNGFTVLMPIPGCKMTLSVIISDNDLSWRKCLFNYFYGIPLLANIRKTRITRKVVARMSKIQPKNYAKIGGLTMLQEARKIE